MTRASFLFSTAMGIELFIVRYAHSFTSNGSPPSVKPSPMRRRKATVFCMQTPAHHQKSKYVAESITF